MPVVKYNVETSKRIEHLYRKENLNIKEVGEVLGISPSSVDSVMKRFGIPKRSRGEATSLAYAKGKRKIPAFRRGPGSPLWKGGIYYTKPGYRMKWFPNHSRANNTGYVFEHILVWEETHRQALPPGYIIHHLNGLKDDNRPVNLVAVPKRQHPSIIEPYKARICILEARIAALEKRVLLLEAKQVLEEVAEEVNSSEVEDD